ncbi:MAG: UMP kinase [Pseudomonadota bacterium]|nr:UMP kinase [Pseudomonadota bacterium]
MGSPYKRIALKVSGDVLFDFDGAAVEKATDDVLTSVLTQIKNCQQQGIEVVVIFGGGNICRGKSMVDSLGIKRTTADNIGMLATVINSLIIREKLTKMGADCVLLSAFEIPHMMQPFETHAAIRHLKEGRVVICCGGTGNPFVTTDTATSLRGAQTEVDAIIKLTDVNGVYDKDPNKHADAQHQKHVDYDYCIANKIEVMDVAAFNHCRMTSIPIHVASYKEPDVIIRVANGGEIGTRIAKTGD